jgi:hypothetical protein
MGMLEIHKEALKEISPVYHDFLGKYKKSTKCVYGFVEGIEDPSFYQTFIEQNLPDDWQIFLWPAGKKDKVLELYSKFNWNCFPRCQIAFFIDRDLSNFVKENLPDDINVYITDNYSIENDVVNRSTCGRVLNEVFNFISIPIDEREKIFTIFEKELNNFLKSMIPIMAWIIYWKRMNYHTSLDNIEMKHIFKISKGKLVQLPNPKGKKSIREYIHSQCKIKIDNSVNILAIEKEFTAKNQYKHFTRGKYLLWFFIEFSNSVHKDISKILPSVKESPKTHTNLCQSNGLVIVGTRTRIPKSLKVFLNNTYGSYSNEIGAII